MQSTNTEEIFQLLSQKIAKYCQILSDLTSSDVFFKSSLNQRSFYWGTYKMVFTYTHHGLQYDRNTESLLKINDRSLTSDIDCIVDELLNVDNNDDYDLNNKSTSKTLIKDQLNNSKQSDNDNTPVEIKDCIIFADRLDDTLYEEYLRKYEKSREYIDDDDIDHEDQLINEDDDGDYDDSCNTSSVNTFELSNLYTCNQCTSSSSSSTEPQKSKIKFQNLPKLKV